MVSVDIVLIAFNKEVEISIPRKNLLEYGFSFKVIESKNQDLIPIGIGYYELKKINDALGEINRYSPKMTNSILTSLMFMLGEENIYEEEFLEIIKTNDFFMSGSYIEWSVENLTKDLRNELFEDELAACYLCLHLKIPFAKKINKEEINKLAETKESINWDTVWILYEEMGFYICGEHVINTFEKET